MKNTLSKKARLRARRFLISKKRFLLKPLFEIDIDCLPRNYDIKEMLSILHQTPMTFVKSNRTPAVSLEDAEEVLARLEFQKYQEKDLVEKFRQGIC